MRFAIIAAAIAAACITVPAQAAVRLGVIPSGGTTTITGGEIVRCQLNPYSCTSSPPPTTVSFGIGDFETSVPDFNGTYAFGPFSYGPNSNAGVYNFTGSLTFEAGSLISDVINFTFRQTQFGGQNNVVETTLIGTITNFAVRDLATGRIITPVPEPMTWALMLVGFAAVGSAMRRRRATVRYLPVAA
jgi:hypothetical protein